MKSFAKLASCLAAIVMAVPAQAAIITSVEIRNAIPTWLQVGELELFQVGTGRNVALATNGGVATASSVFGFAALGQPANYAVAGFANDGSTNGDYGLAGNGIFHSGTAGGSEWLRITLAAATDVRTISIHGRTDGGNGVRDVYNYFAYNGSQLVATGRLDATRSYHFATADLGVAPVPEPATWMMLLAGFGIVGFAMRNRRNRIAALV
ncbi:MAG: PEPxxWA-CTERM sorting domain-containing protein [Sphingomonadaceae bacterium]